MSSKNILKDKVILAVDDEPDVLETVEEELKMCVVHITMRNLALIGRIKTMNFGKLLEHVPLIAA